MANDETGTSNPEGLLEQRESLHTRLIELERALAGAGPGRIDDWSADVAAAMTRVADAFAEHVHFTEDADGLFADVMRRSPGLAAAVETLRIDHQRIDDCLRENLVTLAAGVSGDHAAWVDRVRASAGALMGQLTYHRQQGADLTYAAFWDDEGGSG
ncbi:MAG: hemerythrin domain-containing protein [Acidimicrobiales bacterium]